jgi:hypothetical protein
MKGARLLLLILHGHVPQNVDERLGFVMRSFERTPVGQWGQRPRDFFSGHDSGAAASGHCVWTFLIVSRRFV